MRQHTTKFKFEQAKKHKVCLMCLKTCGNKAVDCRFATECVVCKKTHNKNLHSHKEQKELMKNQPDSKQASENEGSYKGENSSRNDD